MNQREKAIELIRKMKPSKSDFINQLNMTDRGIHFILGYLEDTKGKVIAGDLAKHLNVSTARIAVLIKKMESRSLIRTYSSPEDARKTIIEITEMGKKQVDAFQEELILGMERLIEVVGVKDIEEFIRISMKIKEAIEHTNEV
ncbi:MAG: MarR family transcriptional regulator [Prevotella sp.]|nr:MarR family transcriptional regulator [Staphylococcus sp.]MCM1350153.1 MarR family transcriptional regulator [Prevotella sp.]